jgi:hypothetical protein
MFERKTPGATRGCVDIEDIGSLWKWICLGISLTVNFRSIGSLVRPESTLAGLTRKYAATRHRCWMCMINHFPIVKYRYIPPVQDDPYYPK